MARAKRTDRAEARRQYRAYLASQQEAEAAAAAEGAAEQSQTRATFARRPAPDVDAEPRPGERLGMLGAARAATRTYSIRSMAGDVRDIPWLVTRTRAVWPIALLCLAGVVISYPRIHSNLDVSSDPILSLVFQFVLYPMPLLPPMLAGFLAPRATWLAGAIAAAISTGLFIFMVAATPIATIPADALAAASAEASAAASAAASAGTTPVATTAESAAATTGPAATPTAAPSTNPQGETGIALISSGELPGAASGWLLTALPFGAVIGAAAGWYKRFLEYIGPRGGAARRPQPKKPVRKPGRR